MAGAPPFALRTAPQYRSAAGPRHLGRGQRIQPGRLREPRARGRWRAPSGIDAACGERRSTTSWGVVITTSGGGRTYDGRVGCGDRDEWIGADQLGVAPAFLEPCGDLLGLELAGCGKAALSLLPFRLSLPAPGPAARRRDEHGEHGEAEDERPRGTTPMRRVAYGRSAEARRGRHRSAITVCPSTETRTPPSAARRVVSRPEYATSRGGPRAFGSRREGRHAAGTPPPLLDFLGSLATATWLLLLSRGYTVGEKTTAARRRAALPGRR
jgi:hypothetical protein